MLVVRLEMLRMLLKLLAVLLLLGMRKISTPYKAI